MVSGPLHWGSSNARRQPTYRPHSENIASLLPARLGRRAMSDLSPKSVPKRTLIRSLSRFGIYEYTP